MSRSREAEVLILDTNPSLGTHLQAAKDSFVLHVQQKLIQMPTKSEIGLVLLGAADSNNNLASSGGYENVCEHKPISPVDTELVRNILGLNHGIDAGDWLDAVVVAMDMINRHCEGKKYEKSIIMITNGARPVIDEEQLTVIAQTCLDIKIRFRLYHIDQSTMPSSPSNTAPSDGERNANLLKDFTTRVNGEKCSINDLHKLKGALSRGSVSSQTVTAPALSTNIICPSEPPLHPLRVFAPSCGLACARGFAEPLRPPQPMCVHAWRVPVSLSAPRGFREGIRQGPSAVATTLNPVALGDSKRADTLPFLLPFIPPTIQHFP
jgi:hypothetical protein